MGIYSIHGFDQGPHWDQAFIEADTVEAAIAILEAKLTPKEDELDTVWKPQPSGDWFIAEVKGPLCYILGAGCR